MRWLRTLGLTCLGVLGASSVCIAEAGVLKADLSVLFSCPYRKMIDFEGAVESFLRGLNFDAVNQARVRRQNGVYLEDVLIIGLDKKRRFIKFFALRYDEGRLSVTFNTPPPTKREANIEASILNFMSESLGCEQRQISRKENEVDATGLHEAEVKRIEGILHQANRSL